MKKTMLLLLLFLSCITAGAAQQPEFSTAGFFEIPNSGREVFSMNPAWRFHKGAIDGAEARSFDDSGWAVVSLPHGIDYLPTEASGCTNFQGEVWYRKHFSPEARLKGRKLFMHFEAIMGKSRVYVNGRLLAEHFGGYLPVVVDVTDAIDWQADNVVSVWTDNSDDPYYPPGKAQDVLDFTYFGGIYRDCWLVAHDRMHITDPNYENVVAGGGLFVSYDKVSDASALVRLQLHLRNERSAAFAGMAEFELVCPDGTKAATINRKIAVKAGRTATVRSSVVLEKPMLWSPELPQLYNLFVRIRDAKGNVIDGYRRRIGVRSVEFKGKDGFWLNGKLYENPLIGANRHQDFAVVGNAVPNSLHWRDAKKLRDAGLKVIRNAHCPQDPAFMDACDELGLFVLDNTPGWQFWNDAPVFAQRVYSDIRNLVRRDRNHACLWMFEPILNETWYPADFAKTTQNIVKEEYPYPYCYSGCDATARGHEYYSIQFTHPVNGAGGAFSADVKDDRITCFTREWGDNVDDWSSHNSPSRVARNWGEVPMLVQAQHYAKPSYHYTSYDALYRTSRQHIGGCLWHSFDHQRGYHPDPFYGGLMDVFRQPKYSYYMFKSQRSAVKEDRPFETGPMVYIAHEMTPFSPKDVTVYSNCDEVRLTYNKGGKVFSYHKPAQHEGMPSPVITFKDVYDFMIDKEMSRDKRQDDVWLLAEGIIDGKVVATHKVCPARRPEKIMLWIDNEGEQLRADGSDAVVVVAAVADRNGNIKRLNNDYIKFSIEGEGRILGGADVLANPAPVKWGTAPVLVQSTLKPGKIRLTASVLFEGSQMPVSGSIEFESVPAAKPLVFSYPEAALIPSFTGAPLVAAKKSATNLEAEQKQRDANNLRLKEVEQQQEDFGEKK